jgi:hypothetical protein
MKRILRRMYRMFNKPKRKYYKKYNDKVTFQHIDDIYKELHTIRDEIRSLATSVKRQRVQGIYMDEKDAKKYKDNGSIYH